MLPRFSLHWQDEGVKRVLRLMAPAINLGVSVSPGQLVDQHDFCLLSGDRRCFLAVLRGSFDGVSVGDAGGGSWGYFAAFAFQVSRQREFRRVFPVAGLGLAPHLTAGGSSGPGVGDHCGAADYHLFYHGAFSSHDVLMTRNALVAYSVGLLGLILVKVLAPGFYARQNIRTPVKIALVSLFVARRSIWH